MRGGIASFFDVMTSRIQQAKRVSVASLGIYAKTEAIFDSQRTVTGISPPSITWGIKSAKAKTPYPAGNPLSEPPKSGGAFPELGGTYPNLGASPLEFVRFMLCG